MLKIAILALAISFVSTDASTNGNISFINTHVYVQEQQYAEATFNLRREGGTSGIIFVTCKILNSTNTTEFIDSAASGHFSDGATSSSCVFTVVNDNIPEPDTTYSVGVEVFSGGAVIGSPSVAYVTILANDDPYGVVGFEPPGQVMTVNEPALGNQVFTLLNISRSKGKIGRIEVFWQVLGGLDAAMNDLSPISGTIVFESGEAFKQVNISTLPDNIAENEKRYTIQLINSTGGARISSTSNSVELRIAENDAPLQFTTPIIYVTEFSTITVNVSRGIANSQRIGSIAGTATVTYTTINGSAKAGIDYQYKTGMLTFADGVTSGSFDVQVLNDTHPEILENFTIVLSNPSANAIIGGLSSVVVNIEKNDDPHGVISFASISDTILNEDAVNSANVQVDRSRGTFGTVVVHWRAIPGTRTPTVVPSDELFQSSGFLVFENGVPTKNLNLTIRPNLIPSEAKELFIELSNVTGGARFVSSLSGLPRTRVVIQDNDNAYGIVYFGSQTENSIILSSTPRRAVVAVHRSGGAFGAIRINYTATYVLPGSRISSSSVQLTHPTTLTMAEGARNSTITIQIAENSFLKSGASIIVTLNAIELLKSTIISPQSPVIGNPSTTRVNVTTELADGEIAFFNNPVNMVVNELDINNDIQLQLMRDGTANQATVNWRLISSSSDLTMADITPWNGAVIFPKGSDRVNITLTVNADTIPELDESFVVELENATEDNERLRVGATRANVTISRNDNPGGTFEFNYTGSIILQEKNQVFTLDVIRIGGKLTLQRVKIEIKNGRDDFVFYQSSLTFNPQETKKPFYIYPKDDNIPEIDETFEIVLTSIDGSILGSRTVVNVTILQNEDANGIFSFFNSPNNLNKKEVELRNVYRPVSFEIVRGRGRFGAVSVSWNVTSLNNQPASLDIQPLSGRVDFENGASSKQLVIRIKPDKIPEGEEVFSILLTNVTGGGKLQNPLQATLTVNQNDAPISFLYPTASVVNEGEIANFTITLNRTLLTNITVTYSTENITASSSTRDYIGFVNRTVTFLPNETRKSISIQTIDDNIPEISETFKVFLVASSGDTVLVNPTEAVVTIAGNDDPYGVFEFSAASNLYRVAAEGDSISFEIQRSRGAFNIVNIHYEIFSSTRQPIALNGEFTKTKGSVVFQPGSTRQNLNLQINNDNVPELNETFYIKLTNVSGNFNIVNGARLGNRTEAAVLILANDEPSGVLRFAPTSLAVSVAEDYEINSINATYANLTIERRKGSFGSIQALWQLYSAVSTTNLPTRMWDLTFHGEKGKDVLETTGRNNSGTNAFHFNTSNASYLYVNENGQPLQSSLTSEFSISMWLKPNKDTRGTLVSKYQTGTNDLVYAIGIDNTMSITEITVQVSTNNYTFSLPGSVNLFDGNWHSLILTFSSSNVVVHINGVQIESKSLTSVVSNADGYIYVGCNLPSNSHYNGTLQDVRLYTSELSSALIREISLRSKAMTPVSGYVKFDNLVSSRNIILRTIDNENPQENAVYILRLIDIKNGGKLSTVPDITSRITILKSDNANGQFEFQSSSCTTVTRENQTSLTYVVKRTIASFGDVTVNWEIRQRIPQRPLATGDFQAATGRVLFTARELEKTITVNPINDAAPELEENFELRLVSAIPSDGATASTPTSGASIRQNYDTCNITLLSNDNPYGLLQISANRPVAVDYVRPLAKASNVNVQEESGTLSLYVIRAQGTQGTVTCEWKTNPLTARADVDFTSSIGTISFAPGVNSTQISIPIIDNSVPELGKTFRVQLYNPTGGAVLGTASYINVTILPSDDAFGVFSFANSSNTVTVSEGQGTVQLTIARKGGLLGAVNVAWRLNNGLSDFATTQGSVMFATNENEKKFTIPIIDDSLPELSEEFVVELVNVSRGRIEQLNKTLTIQISANDDPYGLFVLPSSPIRQTEGNKTINIAISRQRGSLGSVRVFFQTVSTSTALANVDYQPISDSVVFMDGQTTANINVTIFDDEIPESDETILVNLTSVVLLNGTEILDNSPRIGNSRIATVIISANDNANGVLQFSASSITVYEGMTGTFLNLTRTGGTFSQVSVEFQVNNNGETNGADYTITSSTRITLNIGERSAVVPITINDDATPEFAETFIISLIESSVIGGAAIGSPRQCFVTIAESDFPYGLIGFASASMTQSAIEPSSGSLAVYLTVQRRFGTNGAIQVTWNATLNGQLASSDLAQTRGTVQFLSGEASQNIMISVLADDVPEDNEGIIVHLESVSNGQAVIDNATSRAVVNILPNDDAYGVVQFIQSALTVKEAVNDSIVYLNATRTKGLFGTIKVFYRTKDAQSAMNQASSGTDYGSAFDQTIEFAPGQSFQSIPITIYKDNQPELDEQFLVEVTKAETVGITPKSTVRIGTPNTMNITISANDDPYGLFTINIANTGTDGRSYAIIEPDSGRTSISFDIKRTQGSLGVVSVSWRVASTSTINTTSDVSGVSGGRIEFNQGETTKQFNIAVNSDNIPEIDEYLVIELHDPFGGASIDASKKEATLVIKANDGVGGRIGFSAGSRSKTVNEGENVTLAIYRTMPAAGNVSLNWTIEGMNASLDFTQTSGKLFIKQGVAQSLLVLTTTNDSIPERNDLFTVRLSDPITSGVSETGAAVLVAGDSTATVIIGASDEPHGIIEFAPRSQPIKVTETYGRITLRLIRTMGSIGDAIVHFKMQGISVSKTITEATEGEDFTSTSNNSVIITNGNDSGSIYIDVINDMTPEQDEAFFVNITKVELRNGGNVTVPPKIGGLRSMQIQIEANDGTQGELSFAAQYERITVSEDIGSFNVTVIRHKGNFGDVYAFYFINQLTASSSDFFIAGGVMNGPAKLSFANGVRVRNITVYITNDNITEPDEQFEIGLTVQNAVNNGGVTIGSISKSLVTIRANDDANGVISFATRSIYQSIEEPQSSSSDNETAIFYIERKIGLYGVVNVQWSIIGVSNSSDINPVTGSVVFAANDREKSFQINALQDNIPELDKRYTIQLTVSSGGARVGNANQATLIVAANDDPNGIFRIRSYPSLSTTINIEETTPSFKAIVQRNSGHLGTAFVQYRTRQASAISSAGTRLQFGYSQILNTRSAQSFHPFDSYGRSYLLLASSYSKQLAGSMVTRHVIGEQRESTLFRWQGVFVPIITLITDGAVEWRTHLINNDLYMLAVNHGTTGSYQTYSQLFKFNANETVQLVQNITTQGATDALFFSSNADVYLVISNQIDNAGNTHLQTQLLKWQGNHFGLESASLSTVGAASLASFSIGGSTYLSVANSYDSSGNTDITSSSVYVWSSANKRFTLSQNIQTQGANDVDSVNINGEVYLFVTNSKSASRLYRYKTTSPVGFTEIQEITIANAKTGKFFNWNNTIYLVIAANESTLFKWDGNSKQFLNLTNLPVKNAESIVPFNATDAVSGLAQYLAVAVYNAPRSFILRLAMLSVNSDYVSRNGELVFYEGQSSILLDFTILRDSLPEMDETFSIDLESPKGGAKLDTNPNMQVSMLSNDNAYGRLAFTDASLHINVTEQSWDSPLTLGIWREFGSFGQVSVYWNITGSNASQITNDLYPSSGQINLNQGVSRASILINVRADQLPELNERFIVRLTSVSMTGSSDSNKGPTINHLKNTAIVTISANDDPYGVVQWKNQVEVTTQQKEVNSSAILVISRLFGTFGDILVYYETMQATSVSGSERIAIPGIDYFSKKSSVLMNQGAKEAIVYVKVRHDNNTGVNEVFHVKITNVSLVSGSLVPNSPRINAAKSQIEVVITEVVLNRGSVEFTSSNVRRVQESVGIVSLRLHRINGSEGTVAVHFTASGINASSADFSPQNGLVTFPNNSTQQFLNIRIVDDNIAELREVLVVTLTKPSGGVVIGNKKSIEILIEENDYPYGIFRVIIYVHSYSVSFNPSSRMISNATEGSNIILRVDRNQGLHRTINVTWSCGPQAQNDLLPWFGHLIFADNVTMGMIRINVADDNIPEIEESYTCSLLTANNGAIISADNTANITIGANDKPHGVVGVDTQSRSIVVAEPTSTGYNGKFLILLRRSVGFDGAIEVNWRLRSLPGVVDNAANTFNSTTGKVVFQSGTSMQKIYLEVKDDNIAEESSVYELSLTAVTGGAEFDTSINATKSFITVAASEQPYGVIQFISALPINVSENAGYVNLTIIRSIGFIGRVRVMYATSSNTATPGIDFSPTHGEVIFNTNETTKTIRIDISNDAQPELAESFKVNITQVQMMTTRILNFGFMNGIQVDTPPQIGSNSSVTVTIVENDNPYGTIEFFETSRLVHERDGSITIPVNRTGGSFGSSTVYYTVNEMNATSPDDFTVVGTSLTFAGGERLKFITVNIINDRISEFQERFSLVLTSITGKANLGVKTRIILTIETSDNPYGLFGIFNTSLKVQWKLIRITQSSSAITEDITPASGSVIFETTERGPKPINITVLPFGGEFISEFILNQFGPQEPEDKFILNVYSASGGAALDHSVVNVTITVLKKGHPNGLFAFEGTINPSSIVDEPHTGRLQINIPVTRSAGTTGLVNVAWAISSLTGTIQGDVRIANFSVSFANGETRKNLAIDIIADETPELDEVYKVMLVSADNGAEIESARNSINFTVRANDYPHGLFKLVESGKAFEYHASNFSRVLHFNIERTKGTVGSVRADVHLKYSVDNTIDTVSAIFTSGQIKAEQSFSIPSGRFLEFGGNFSIELQSFTMLTAVSSMAPAKDPSSPKIVIIIPEMAANSIVEFDTSTRMLSASQSFHVNNVIVSRRGLFGSFSVDWRSGYPVGSFVIGSINPPSGSLSFAHGERQKTFSFNAVVPSVLQANAIYAVYLSSVSLTAGRPGWPKLGSSNTTIVEPHGVIEIAQNYRSLTVSEGSQASIEIRRLLSTMGSIRVHYSTQAYTGVNAAISNVDYRAITSYVDMIQGQTTATIGVNTIDDLTPLPEKDELFYVRLTSIEMAPGSANLALISPRLSTDQLSTITIRDNDNPFGVISFTTQSTQTTIQESSRNVRLNLIRNGGVFSTAKVLVRTIGGGEPWQNQVINTLPANIQSVIAARSKAASALQPNQDYLPINKEVTFEELNTVPAGGQIKSLNLTILQDAVSEPAEQIIIILTNVTGGAKLPSPTENTKAYSIVTIDGNGLWNGVIGFPTKTASINEDTTAQVTIPLQRVTGSAEMIEVKWYAWSPILNLANQLPKTSGNTSFVAGSSLSSITIMLKNDTTPEFASWFFINLTTSAPGAIIAGSASPLSSYCNISVAESDYPAGRFGFDETSSYTVVELDYYDTKQLVVRRYNGNLNDVTVRYATISPLSVVNENGLVLTPAIGSKDYVTSVGTLSFPKGKTEAYVNLQFNKGTASSTTYPKVFNVTLSSPTNGAVLYPLYATIRLVISKDTQTPFFWALRSRSMKRPLTDAEIEDIFADILKRIASSLNENSQLLIIATTREITAYKRSLPIGSKAFRSSTKTIILNIFDSLLSSSRTDTRGKSTWAVLLDELAYDFLNDAPCPYSFTGTKTNFALTSKRDQQKSLNGIKFSGKNSDFFRYPVNMFSSSSTTCTNLHYINYNNEQLFSSGEKVLNNKVMSSSIKSGLTTGMKIVYRIHTSKARIVSKRISCVIWNHGGTQTKGNWNSKNCKVKAQSKTYIECECKHLSQYAVLATSDDRTGYEGACFLALLSYQISSFWREKTISADLFMHMLFAIMMTNILYVVGAYISPSLINKQIDCGILGLAMHYFFLAQFSWIAAQAWNFWLIFVINDERTGEKFVHFFLFGWGTPVLFVAGHVIVVFAAYRWPFSLMYGDVHNDGVMCFMQNAYAALGSAIAPVLFFLLTASIVFFQAYQVKPQWECYDDIYAGRHNKNELSYLLILYGLLTLTWLFGGLHLAFGKLWMIATFTALNIFLVIMIIRVINNNLWLQCK
eukprot:gene9868-10878_t